MPHHPPRFHLVAIVLRPGGGSLHYAWRLLGPNHRELGRSSQVLDSIEQAATSATYVGLQCEEFTAQHRRIESPPGGWVWQLFDDAAPVVHSSRTYFREREALYSQRAFLEAAPRALLRLPEQGGRLPQVRVESFMAHSLRGVSP